MANCALFTASRQHVAIAAARIVTILGLLCIAWLPSHAAVAWVGGSHTVCAQPSSGIASQTCTLTAATAAGDDVVVGIAWSNTAATIVNVSGSSPTSWFIPYAEVCNGTNECVATFLCHHCTAQTAITATMSEGTHFVTTAEEYSGVQAVGITGAQTATSATPGLTMATGDANDWTVCATSTPGNAGMPSAGTGTLRGAASTGTTSSDVAGGVVDNTASTAASVVCTDTVTSNPWAATGIELRSVAPRTYVWPDCDTAHPCIVHHIDTVAAGTAENETPNGFKLTTVPSSAGNLLTLTVTHASTQTITISDNNSGAWQSAVTTTNANDYIETQLFYICGAVAKTSVVTIQLSEPPAPGEILQFSYNEVSGIAASTCLDGATAANGLTGNVQPGSIATTVDGDLIYNFGEETYNYPEEDSPIGWVMPDDSSALLMESAFDKFASQVSVQAAHGAYNPTLHVNGDLNARNWNSVAAAFKASAGAGTQPTGIHVTRVMHYYNPPLPQTPAWLPFPSTGNALVITSAYPSSGYEGDMTDVADNQGDTWTRTPFTIANDDPQIYYTCFGSASSSRDLTIDWLPDTGTTHMILYDIAAARTTGGSVGCMGATVNSQTGNQPSSANASIIGAPAITPESSGSVILAVNQLGIGPPSGTLTANAVFASIWATGMTDATNWDSGDCYGYIYTTSTNPISFNWQMANANGLPDGGSNYDGAAIEILPFVQPQLTSIAVTPANPAISVGATQQFVATGTYTGGSTQDITGLATWSAAPATTSTINAGGLATGVCPGSATITASMSNVSGQTSLSVTGLAATKSVFSVSPTPPVAGQAATLTAAVTSGCGTPAGLVQFVVDGVNNGSPATLNGSGLASTSVTLASGSHTLSAVYSGSTTFSTSTSNTLSETVAAAATTTTLSASPTGSLSVGSSYTLMATVKSASGTTVPTGSVLFTIGSVTQTVALNASGVATYSGTAPLAAGPLTIFASYQGSTDFSASTSSALNVTITALGTTTTAAISPTGGSLTEGSSYTLTATVTPASGSTIPTGNVVFTVGSATQTVALNASGVATYSGTAPLTPGPLAISAVYQGSAEFSASTSNSLSEIVVATSTATTLTTSANQITQGASVTLTATVSAASGSTVPSGSVNFYSGPVLLGTSSLTQGTATLTSTVLPAGTDSLTAAYAGSVPFAASTSSPVTVVVSNALVNTTTTLTTSASQVNAGTPVTLTAAVAAVSGTTVPTGSVSFYNGTALLGSSTLSGGVASLTTSNLPAGSDAIVGSYAGNSSSNPSVSNTVTIAVTALSVNTTTSLSIAPGGGSLTVGSPFTITATVTPASGTTVPSGNVVFTIGSTVQAVALNSSGVAAYSGVAPLASGTLAISAAYQGSATFTPSVSTPLSENLVAIATTTAVSITPPGSLTAASAYTVTAAIAPASGGTIPAGSVVFNIGSGAQTVALNSSGIAVWTGTAPGAGTLTISATYQGSAEFSSSTSNPVTETILAVPTNTMLIASAAQVVQGSPVTLTATVTTATNATVTGSVDFYNGTGLLGTVPLSASVASLTTSALPTGKDVMNAMYEGNSTFAASSFSGLPIVVTGPSNPAPVITGISPALALAGNSAFTLAVTGSGFTSASTVAWGSNVLVTQFESTSQLTAQVPASDVASAGIASVTVATPAPGGGNSNLFQFEIDSAGSAVTAPAFTPSTGSIAPGSTATYQVALPAAATNVSATCLNLPAGATCSYSAASNALTIATSSATLAGTYSITVVFTETLPVAVSAFALWPFVLLPIWRRGRGKSHHRLWLIICLGSGLIASAVVMGGCGGGGGGSSNVTPPPPTQQVTSSGVVTLTLQ